MLEPKLTVSIVNGVLTITDTTDYPAGLRNTYEATLTLYKVNSEGVLTEVSLPSYDKKTVQTISVSLTDDGRYRAKISLQWLIGPVDLGTQDADILFYDNIIACNERMRDSYLKNCKCITESEIIEDWTKVQAAIKALDHSQELAFFQKGICIIEKMQPICKECNCGCS